MWEYGSYCRKILLTDYINQLFTLKHNTMKRLTPSDSVFNRLYLFNLLSDKGNKVATLKDAEFKYPALSAAIKKLNDNEVRIFIDKIENLM